MSQRSASAPVRTPGIVRRIAAARFPAAFLAAVMHAAVAVAPVHAQAVPATPAETPPAAAARPAPPAVTVSGIVFGNYQYMLGGPRKDFSQFLLDRAYLTVRGTPAPRTGIRLTSDVYQAEDNGWSVRMKYAYVDYRVGGSDAWATTLRAGMLQTVAIEHLESFWPRWLGPVAIDRHGFFQSADVGAAALTVLPAQLGEVYAHVVNGTGYTRREADRYKDLGVRASVTPFAGRATGVLASMALTAWVYEGATAGAPLTDGSRRPLSRDRWGLHAGIRGARLTAAIDHSRSSDDIQTGSDPLGVVVTPRDGAITSAFAIVRPLAPPAGTSRFGVVGRYDQVERGDLPGSDYHYVLGGALYDVNSRLSIALNYQEQMGIAAPSPFRGVLANVVVSF